MANLKHLVTGQAGSLSVHYGKYYDLNIVREESCSLCRQLTTEMKLLSLILTFLLISIGAYGELKSATAELNRDLIPVYESLKAAGPSSDLIGKRLKLNLNLKHASDRHLLFTDTRIVIDSNTSYYMIKWKFKPDDVKALSGKTKVRCTVTGRIVDVIKGPTSPGMPYIVVELESIEF